MWRIRARRVGPSVLLDRGREWQAQGQLPAHGPAGRGTRAQSRAVRAGRALTWASGLATSSILRWSCCGPPDGKPQQLQLRPPYARTAPLGPRSGKPNSASGSCRAILRWEGRQRCAQQLRSQERPAQRHARALPARLQSSGACSRGCPDADVAGDRSAATARAAAKARVPHHRVR
eukprot:scaffold1424_cov111-Isochrysis_galbana.AAC.4